MVDAPNDPFSAISQKEMCVFVFMEHGMSSTEMESMETWNYQYK